MGSCFIQRGLETFCQEGAIRARLVAENFHSIEDEGEQASSLWIIQRIDVLFDDHIVRLIDNTVRALEEQRIHVDFDPILCNLIERTVEAIEASRHARQECPPLLAALAEDARQTSWDLLRDRALSDIEVAEMIIAWNEGLDMLPRNSASEPSFARDLLPDTLLLTLLLPRPHSATPRFRLVPLSVSSACVLI